MSLWHAFWHEIAIIANAIAGHKHRHRHRHKLKRVSIRIVPRAPCA